jgi:hypothetical protein
MPSGEFAPGTTWRPIEEATTPWVPNLKLPATELSKNISTLTANIASNSNTTFLPQLPLTTDPASNLRLPMSFLIGLHVRKHYPWYLPAAPLMT